MKRNLILIGVIISAAIAFTSCEKEEVSVDENTIKVIIDNDESLDQISMYDKNFSIDAMLIPDGLNSEIEIKISSNADPDGFTKTVTLSDRSYTEGKLIYNYKRLFESFNVALFTDADREAIKVNEGGDIVTVDIGNGLHIEEIPFNSEPCAKIQYWGEEYEDIFTSTIFIYQYNFDGSQNPSIEVWSSHDETKVTYELEWNDPTQYNGLPNFNNYQTGVEFALNSSTSDNRIGVVENCTVYIKYDNITYLSVFNESTTSSLPKQ